MLFNYDIDDLSRDDNYLHDGLSIDIFCGLLESAHVSLNLILAHRLWKFHGKPGLSVE